MISELQLDPHSYVGHVKLFPWSWSGKTGNAIVHLWLIHPGYPGFHNLQCIAVPGVFNLYLIDICKNFMMKCVCM
jgi:hypothetical protein